MNDDDVVAARASGRETVEELRRSGALDALFERLDAGEVEMTGSEGLFPVGGGVSFDEAGVSCSFVGGFACVCEALGGSFVFDFGQASQPVAVHDQDIA